MELLEFLAWSLFYKRLEDITVEENKQLGTLLSEFEGELGLHPPPGRNPNVQCLRPTLDPLFPIHHPLIYYSMCESAYLFSCFYLKLKGFKRVYAGEVTGWIYSPPEHSAKPPLLFFHGVGVGIFPYLQ